MRRQKREGWYHVNHILWAKFMEDEWLIGGAT